MMSWEMVDQRIFNKDLRGHTFLMSYTHTHTYTHSHTTFTPCTHTHTHITLILTGC